MIRRIRNAPVVAGLVVLATLGLSGCGGESTPAGYTHVEDGWLALDVPEEWVDTGAQAEWWTRSWQDVEDDDEATVQLLAAPTFGYYGAFEGEGIIIAGHQVGGLPGYTFVENGYVTESEDLDLFRTDFTYDGDGEEITGVLWTAADPGTKKTVAVQLTGLDLSDDVVDAIERSIRVLDTEDGSEAGPADA